MSNYKLYINGHPPPTTSHKDYSRFSQSRQTNMEPYKLYVQGHLPLATFHNDHSRYLQPRQTTMIQYEPYNHGHAPRTTTKRALKRLPRNGTKHVGRCRFLEIAAELRLEVYEHLFSSSDDIRLSLGGVFMRRCKGNEECAAILSVCQTTYYESRDIFLQRMNFRINVITTYALRNMQKDNGLPKLRNMLSCPMMWKIQNMTVDFYLQNEPQYFVNTIGDMAGPIVAQINHLGLKKLHINLTVSVGVHQACFDTLSKVLAHLRCRVAVVSGTLVFSGAGYRDLGGFRRSAYPDTTTWTNMLCSIGGSDVSDPTPFEIARDKFMKRPGSTEGEAIYGF